MRAHAATFNASMNGHAHHEACAAVLIGSIWNAIAAAIPLHELGIEEQRDEASQVQGLKAAGSIQAHFLPDSKTFVIFRHPEGWQAGLQGLLPGEPSALSA